MAPAILLHFPLPLRHPPFFPCTSHSLPLSRSASKGNHLLISCRAAGTDPRLAAEPLGSAAAVRDPHPASDPPGGAAAVTDPDPAVEPPGTGAAAPTRGEIFLDYKKAKASAASILRGATKEEGKKKAKPKPKPKTSLAIACCYGCGAPLQTGEIDAPGYVDVETYELKKLHRQLKTVLCGRCKLLAHGHIVTAVGGHGGYSGGKQFVTADELRKTLLHLREEKVLVVKLVDIVDFNGSFLARIRNIVGANPIILVITKIDLLPKGTDMDCVGDWVVEASAKKKLNVLSVHLTSSKSLVGMAGVISEIQREKKGRDVYILGAANVGKSAFINAMLTMMAAKDPIAAAARKYKPMQSAVPGTTLGPIQINAFQGGRKLFDTPGVHLHHRQSAVVHAEDLQFLAPRSRLKGHTVMASSDNAVYEQNTDLNGMSIFWGGLVRIDIQKVLPRTSLTFYGPRAIQIHSIPTTEADDYYHKEVGQTLTPPSGKERAELWAGLDGVSPLKIQFNTTRRPACDIAISGLGWITVEPVRRAIESSDAADTEEDQSGELEFTVHVPKAVEVFVRPPLPVGARCKEWYEFRELTEEEEASRPKWFF